MFYIFYHVTLAMVIPHTLTKTVNFRHRMNNSITACRYGTSANRFGNHVFKFSNKNKHVAKETYFKVYAFTTVNNEKKNYVMNFKYIKWDLIQ